MTKPTCYKCLQVIKDNEYSLENGEASHLNACPPSNLKVIKMTKKQADKQAAIDELKKEIHEGDTIWTVIRHRSASGMYRAIDFYVFSPTYHCDSTQAHLSGPANEVDPYLMETSTVNFSVEKRRYTWPIATALGYRYDTKHEALGIGACGSDVPGLIVAELSHKLFGDSRKLRKEEI